MERQISKNPSLAEIRLHCLDLAVRTSAMRGISGDVHDMANQHFDWVMRGTAPQQPTTRTPQATRDRGEDDTGTGEDDDDLAALGGGTQAGTEGQAAGPASLRQSAGGTKGADK